MKFSDREAPTVALAATTRMAPSFKEMRTPAQSLVGVTSRLHLLTKRANGRREAQSWRHRGCWNGSGVDLGASHITLYDTEIKNMQTGLSAYSGAIVDVATFATYFPLGGPTDVTIESPAATNFNGISLMGRSSLNISTAKLVINNPGQPWTGRPEDRGIRWLDVERLQLKPRDYRQSQPGNRSS